MASMNVYRKQQGTSGKMEKIDHGDLIQIIIGSLGGAFAFAPTEEFHLISRNIPFPKLVLLFLSTLVFIGLISYCMGVRRIARRDIRTLGLIPVRILIIYGISVLSCLLALWIYDLISVQTPMVIVVKKIMVLALPATAGGTLVDLIGTKNK